MHNHHHQKQDQPQVPLTKDYSEGFESGLQRHHEVIVRFQVRPKGMNLQTEFTGNQFSF